jgi:SAM-dependent methyltransferase
MGIAKSAAQLLFAMGRKDPLKGRVLQLGRQSILITDKHVSQIIERYRPTRAPDRSGPIDDQFLFKLAGFDKVESLDVNGFEGADFVFDLNEPVPDHMHGLFDMIYDGGTLEHVFNFPQALKNIHAMLKVGGVVAHALPTSNHVDHGFYMFSPTVFWDYYTANRYEIVDCLLFEYEPKPNADWVFYRYSPGAIDHKSYGGWGRAMLGTWCVARKQDASTAGVTPQQNLYVRAGWNPSGPPKRAPPWGLDWLVKKLYGRYPQPYATLREPYFFVRRQIIRAMKPRPKLERVSID